MQLYTYNMDYASCVLPCAWRATVGTGIPTLRNRGERGGTRNNGHAQRNVTTVQYALKRAESVRS